MNGDPIGAANPGSDLQPRRYKIIGADGKEYGPVSTEQVRGWLNEGRVNSQTKIKPDGAADWQSLGDLPEFKAALGAPVPGMPSPIAASAASPAKTSGMAVTSLVLGILGFCGLTALVGLILGIVALVRISRSEGRLTGKGLAIAGICVSAFMLLIAIPLMAGLTFPAFAKAKQRAQTINCVNNVKQLALAARMYALDHNDRYPSATNWCDAIQANVGSPRVFQCPTDPSQRCAYAYNSKLAGAEDGKVNPQTVMFFESAAGWNAAGGPELFRAHQHSTTRIGVGFADGSVQQLPRAQLETLRWDP